LIDLKQAKSVIVSYNLSIVLFEEMFGYFDIDCRKWIIQ
jgi:hypothetical protein